jgi:hypothetical protein
MIIVDEVTDNQTSGEHGDGLVGCSLNDLTAAEINLGRSPTPRGQ